MKENLSLWYTQTHFHSISALLVLTFLFVFNSLLDSALIDLNLFHSRWNFGYYLINRHLVLYYFLSSFKSWFPISLLPGILHNPEAILLNICCMYGSITYLIHTVMNILFKRQGNIFKVWCLKEEHSGKEDIILVWKYTFRVVYLKTKPHERHLTIFEVKSEMTKYLLFILRCQNSLPSLHAIVFRELC